MGEYFYLRKDYFYLTGGLPQVEVVEAAAEPLGLCWPRGDGDPESLWSFPARDWETSWHEFRGLELRVQKERKLQ